jgi:uncharacterized protein (TIGR03067 family)
MLAKSLWIAPLACLLLAQPDAPEAAKKDLKLLQGTWTMTALEVNGQDVSIDKLEGTTVTIKGDRYEVTVKGKKHGCTLKLDPAKDPKEVDMVFSEPGGADKVNKGIYKVDGDTLKIARGLNPDQARPNQFATWPNTNYFVVSWKRKN